MRSLAAVMLVFVGACTSPGVPLDGAADDMAPQSSECVTANGEPGHRGCRQCAADVVCSACVGRTMRPTLPACPAVDMDTSPDMATCRSYVQSCTVDGANQPGGQTCTDCGDGITCTDCA